MGDCRSYECDKCKYKLELYEGVGMMFSPYRFMYPSTHPDSFWNDVVKSKDIIRKIDELYNNYNGKFVSEGEYITDPDDPEGFHSEYIFPYGYKLYYSKSRKMIYSLFDFKIEYIQNGEKKIYQPNYEKNINYDLVPLGDALSPDIKCPKCGERMHYVPCLIMWD